MLNEQRTKQALEAIENKNFPRPVHCYDGYCPPLDPNEDNAVSQDDMSRNIVWGRYNQQEAERFD